MAIILNGAKLGRKVLLKVRKQLKGRKLKLAVVFVGENKISQVYLGKKKQACEKVGVGFEVFGFSESVGVSDLKQKIKKIVQDKTNSGIVIQLPLPLNPLVTQSLLNLIPLDRDPDCLSEESFRRFSKGKNLILPPVVGAVSKFFREYKISLQGKTAVVVGKGRLVGLPVSIWLKQQRAKVLVCDRKTKDLAKETKKADIIVSGAGSPRLITGEMVKKGAVVIDCGTSVEDGASVGDVEFVSVVKKAGYISPVPGGVGPLAIACLLENLVNLAD